MATTTKNSSMEVCDLGRLGYEEALSVQCERFDSILDHKREGLEHQLNTLFLVEHDPVYTLGKSGKKEHLVNNPATVGATFYHSTRGGDITYHGPGQIVGYPVLDLEHFEMGVGQYIWSIEESIIRVINRYGLRGERLSDASGVWLDVGTPQVRKICAIGVKASRYVTMHGFAFNVNTDLSYFGHIVPCGIQDKGVTTMQKELGTEQDFERLKLEVAAEFKAVFGVVEGVE